MQLNLTSEQLITLHITNNLFENGYLRSQGAYVRMSTDLPEVFEALIEYPKEMCSRYPQYFDLFNAVLDEDDWFSGRALIQ